jgi:hypothetical protein
LRTGGHHAARRLVERLEEQLGAARDTADLDFGEDL